jgi:hypothetical protein
MAKIDVAVVIAQELSSDWSYELYLDPIRIFKKHSVMISASSEGMIIFVQNLGSSGSQFFGN